MTPKTHAKMLAEFEARHSANLAGATGTILALARELQKAAFEPDDPRWHGGFQPAPVYMQQATTIAGDAFVQMRLGNLLWAIGEGLKPGEAPKKGA